MLAPWSKYLHDDGFQQRHTALSQAGQNWCLHSKGCTVASMLAYMTAEQLRIAKLDLPMLDLTARH